VKHQFRDCLKLALLLLIFGIVDLEFIVCLLYYNKSFFYFYNLIIYAQASFFEFMQNSPTKMPFKRRKSRKRRRKTRSSNKINSVVIRGPSAFPDRVFVRLKYTNSIAVSGTTLISSIFSGNDLTKPDFQSTTQLCRGYNEWMDIYSRFKVHKSTIRVEALNLDSLNADLVVVPNRAVPTIIDTEDAREQPYAKSKRISNSTGSRSAVSTYNSMKTKTIYGTRFIDLDFAGSVSTSPPQSYEWYVYVQNLVNDAGTINLDLSVTITYFVELFSRKFIARSTTD